MVEFWRRLQEVEAECALESCDRRLSYAELKHNAREASSDLRGLVSLHFPKSPEYVQAVLACWWAGAAFVPVDPRLPPARQEAILQSARPDQNWREWHAPGPSRAEGPNDLAYVICTSGSSGKPKAVEIRHDGLVPMLEDQIRAFDLGPGKRALWLLSPQFDASLSDIGTALLAGATLCIPPENAALDLPHWLRHFRITHVDLPPALLRRYRPEDFPETVETLIVGGEPSPPEMLRAWSRHFRVVSVYGPTEATICTHLRLVNESWDAPSLGDPIGGMAHLVVDGELWLAGPGLARGYRDGNDTPFVERDGRRYYRTGDRVTPDLVFLGRQDRQVKVRGHRIELDEVEAAMLAAGATRAAAMVYDERLLAFYEGDNEPDVSQTLPAWMVPTLRRLERIPLTSSGKPDRPALARLAEIQQEPLDSLGSLQRAAQLQALGVPVTAVELLGGSPQALTPEQLLRLAPPPAMETLTKVGLGRRILLTGATGQLGRHLLPLLLEEHEVVALVRRPLQLKHPGLTQIVADLHDDWTPPEVDTVFHCAAQVNSVLPLERVRATNLDLLPRLVALGKPLHYASTLSVLSCSDFHGPCGPGDNGQGHLYGGYAQSKWLAEQWLQRLEGVWCYRYGLLLGYPDDGLRRFVGGLLQLGAFPIGPEIRMDVTPIEWAARATLELARGEPGTFHLSSRRGLSLSELVEKLERQGHVLRALPAEQFFALPVLSPEAGAAQLGLCRLHPDPAFFQVNRALDLFQASDVDFLPNPQAPAMSEEYWIHFSRSPIS